MGCRTEALGGVNLARLSGNENTGSGTWLFLDSSLFSSTFYYLYLHRSPCVWYGLGRSDVLCASVASVSRDPLMF